MLHFVVWFLLVVNVAGFSAMGIDKLCAAQGWRRVPEAYLLSMGAFTGAPGVWLGTLVFRHKTVKSSFRRKLVAATLVNAIWFVALRFE